MGFVHSVQTWWQGEHDLLQGIILFGVGPAAAFPYYFSGTWLLGLAGVSDEVGLICSFASYFIVGPAVIFPVVHALD